MDTKQKSGIVEEEARNYLLSRSFHRYKEEFAMSREEQQHRKCSPPEAQVYRIYIRLRLKEKKEESSSPNY